MTEDTMSGEPVPPTSGADIRTFLFADMRGYTRFTQEHGDDAASALAGRFADLVKESVPAFEGELLELRGDEALCVFRSARQALRASVEVQRRLRTATDEEPAFPIGVGIGLDAGEAVPTHGGYRGASLNLAARLCALAKPGEILVSETVIGLASRVEGMRFGSRRLLRVKGLAEPVRVAPVVPDAPFPPLAESTRPNTTRRSNRVTAVAVALVAIVGTVAFVAHELLRSSPSSSALPDDSFALVNGGGHAIVTAKVGQTPFGVAVRGSTAWLPMYADNALLEVNTSTGQTQRIQVGEGPDAVAVGVGGVWVANAGDGTLSQVNPAVGATVGQPIYVGNGPSGVAVGRDLWVALSVDGAVAKIDPTKGRVVDTFSVGTDPTRVAFGYHKVWVTNESVGTVTPIDPLHDRPLTPISVGHGPNALAMGDGSVWVTNSLDGTVSRINPHTLSISATYPAGVDPQGVAVVHGVVWIAARGSDEITRLTRAGEPLPAIHVDTPPQDLASAGGAAAVTTGPSAANHRGGTLVIASGQPLHSSIDPQSPNAWFVQPWETLAMTNDGLVAFKRVPGPDGQTVVADLAQSLPEPPYNGRTYAFQLQTGVKYSNGHAVRATDIRYGIERTFTVKVGSGSSAFSVGPLFFNDIKGAPKCDNHPPACDLNKGIAVDNATGTITFHLTRVDPDFLAKLAMPLAVAVPANIPTTDQNNHPLPATGPYMISRYSPNQGAVLVRNPYFHVWSSDAQPNGNPTKIVWHVYRPGQDITAVEKGGADWLSNEGPPEANRVHELVTTYASQLHISLFPSTELMGIASGPLTHDLVARRAIAYSINRSYVVARLGGSAQAQPTCQLLPPNYPGYRPYCPFTAGPQKRVWVAPDVSRATRLAGDSSNVGKTVTVAAGGMFTNYIAHLLDSIGFHAHVVAADASPPPQIGTGSFVDDYPGADDFVMTYGSPPLTKADIRRAFEQEATTAYSGTRAWAAADRRITRYATIIPLATDKTIGFTSNRVGNYQFSPAPGNDPLIDQMWVK